jgi:hypothetical protein
MKVFVYEEINSGKIRFYTETQSIFVQPKNWSNWQYLGEMEIEPKLPKKVVTKEIVSAVSASPMGSGKIFASAHVPFDAKNIKIVYEVEVD